MSLIATGIGLVSEGSKLVSGVGDFLGIGRSEPNAGKDNLVDAIDNYEKISTSVAQSLQPKIISMVTGGASDMDVARLLASRGGYSVQQVTGSWKWPIVTGMLNQVRSLRVEPETVDSSSTYDPDDSPQAYDNQQRNGTARKPNYIVLAGLAVAGYLIFNS